MEWEKGWEAGLRTAIIAVHRVAREPESVEEVEKVLREQIVKSMERQLELLDEMEKVEKNSVYGIQKHKNASGNGEPPRRA